MPSEDVLLRMKLDTSDFASQLKNIRSSMTDVNNEFKNATSGMDKWGSSVDGLGAKVKQLQQQHELLGQKVSVCKDKLEASKSVLSNNEKYADQLRQAIKQLGDDGYDETSQDVQELKQELEKTEATLNQQKDAVKRCEQEVDSAQAAYDKTGTSLKKYSEKLEEAKSKLAENETAHAKLKQEIEKQESALDKAKNKYKDLVLEQKQGTTEAKQLESEIRQLSSSLNDNKDKLKAAEDATEGLAESQEGARSGLSGIKDAFMEGVSGADLFAGGLEGVAIALGGKLIDMLADAGRAVVDFGKQCIETGMSFDSSMSTVAATAKMDTTSEAFDSLRNKALEMGSTTKFSASEAADAFNYMAMAGWNSEQMIAGIPGVLNLAAASGEELATTSDILTDGLTAFGLAAGDAGHMADVMAAASSSANTNVSMMGESFKMCAPLAGAMGYNVEDTSIALGLMANSGIKATSAGTSLRSILTNLASPTKSVANAMEVLGLSLTDTSGEMLPFMDVMTQLRTAFQGGSMSAEEYESQLELLDSQLASGTMTQAEYETATENLATAAFGAQGALAAQYASVIAGKQGMSGLLAIVNASEEDFAKLTNEIYNCDGAAAQMAATANDNLAGDITTAQSAIEGLQVAISDMLTPAIRPLVQAFSELVGGVTGVLNGAQPLPELFNILGDTWNGLCTVIQSAWDNIAAPIFDFIVEKFQRVFQEISQHTPQIMEAWNTLCTTLSSLWEGVLAPVIEIMGEQISLILDGLATAFGVTCDAIGVAVDTICSFFTNILLPAIQGVIDVVVALLNGDWAGAWEAAKGIVSGFVDGVGQFLSDVISSLGEFVASGVEAAADFAGQFIDQLAKWASDVVSRISEDCAEFISSLADGLAEGVTTFADAAVEWVKAFVEGMTNLISDGVDAVKNWGKGVVDGFLNFFKGEGAQAATDSGKTMSDSFNEGMAPMPTEAQNTLSQTKANADAFATGISGTGTTAGQGFESGLVSGLNLATQNADSAMSKINGSGDKFASSLADSAKKAGSDFQSNIADGIESAQSDTESTLSEMESEAESFADSMGQSGDTAGSDFTSNLDSSLSESVSQTEATFDSIKQHADQLKSDMGTSASDTGKEYTTSLDAGLKDAVSKTDANMSEINSSAQDLVGDMGAAGTDAGQKFTNNLSSSLQPSISNATSVGAQISSGIASGISSGIGTVVAAAKNVVAQAVAAAKARAEIASPSRLFKREVGVWISRGLAEGIKEAGRYPVEEITNVVDKVVDGAKTSSQAMKTLTDSFKVSSSVSNAANVKSLAENLLKGFGDDPKELKTELEALYDEIMILTEDFVTDYTALMTACGEQAKESIVNAITELKNELDAKYKEMTEAVQTWTPGFVQAGSDAALQFKSEFEQSIFALPHSFKSVLDNLLSMAEAFKADMAAAGAAAGAAFANALTAAMNAAAASATSQAKSIGEAISAGVANGISGSASKVSDAVKSMTSSAVSTAKSDLKIKSPSRVFRDEVGRFIPEGIAEGIKSYSDSVTDELKRLNAAMVESTRPMMSGVSNALSNMQAGTGAGGSISKTINFYQTNTSPKALSRKEIYRQTKNALAFVKET